MDIKKAIAIEKEMENKMEVKEVTVDNFRVIEEKVEAKVYEFPVYVAGTKADGTVVQVVDVRATQRTRASVEQIDAQIAVLQAKKDAILNLNVEKIDVK
jgi:hypothetical protein